MSKSSELTVIELEQLAAGEVDLAAGYPSIKLPKWLEQVYGDVSGSNVSDEVTWPAWRFREIDKNLARAVASLLALDSGQVKNVCILPNGSTAINRVVAFMAMAGGQIVVSSPSFDVIAATISEFKNCSLKVVSSLETNEFDVEGILEAINAECVGVILCSPDNPTGAILTEKDIYRITERAARFGTTVFIDQCFCLCGHDAVVPPLVARYAYPGSNWVMLWDTGKTIGLAHEKLAFLVSSKSVFDSILDRVRVLCFDTSFRTKRIFLEIFQHVSFESYLADFRGAITKNREALEAACMEKGLACHLPLTTSMAHIRLSDASVHDLKGKVHMVPLQVFSLSDEGESNGCDKWYRVALAREHCEFLRAIDQINRATSRYVSN